MHNVRWLLVTASHSSRIFLVLVMSGFLTVIMCHRHICNHHGAIQNIWLLNPNKYLRETGKNRDTIHQTVNILEGSEWKRRSKVLVLFNYSC